MFPAIHRRDFVTSAFLGGFAFLDSLPNVDAAASPAVPRVASVAADVEPLVRLIEETPRADLLGKVVAHIKKGTSHQELLSAVFLAGVRGIQPRPVGFKFHAVLVINSAHQASLAATDRDRWLPLLWSIDYFKGSQEANRKQGNWRMAPPQESELPKETRARETFLAGMDDWDVAQADRGIIAWSRQAGASEVFEPFWRYGLRDFRDIGHKAIYAANAWRTLQTIGWRHAEPVLRSLAYAMLDHEGTNPARRDDWRDRPGRDNLARIEKTKAISFTGKRDPAVSQEVLTSLRKASAAEAGKQVQDLLERGIHPASIWDGLFLHAGELLMRQPGIGGLHTLTTLNALHFAYQTSAVPTTRLLALYQGASFLPLFREFMQGRGKMSDAKLDGLEKLEAKGGIEEILADVSGNTMQAARKTQTLLEKSPGQIEPLMKQARRLIFAKGTDSHDYKFSSAVLEDAYHLAPSHRPAFLAASLFNLKGSGDRDNGLIERARTALSRA